MNQFAEELSISNKEYIEKFAYTSNKFDECK